jgi:acyl dehydratase
MPTKTVIDGVEGLKVLVGKELGASEWKVLLYEDITRFATATGDHQWIHVDRERCARESPFKVPIAHGYYGVSLIGGIFQEVIEPRGFSMILNYGLNKVRFPAPFKEGTRYRMTFKLDGIKEIQNGIETTMQVTLEMEGQPKPACAAEVVYRFMGHAH